MFFQLNFVYRNQPTRRRKDLGIHVKENVSNEKSQTTVRSYPVWNVSRISGYCLRIFIKISSNSFSEM